MSKYTLRLLLAEAMEATSEAFKKAARNKNIKTQNKIFNLSCILGSWCKTNEINKLNKAPHDIKQFPQDETGLYH